MPKDIYSFKQWCVDNEHDDWLNLWDYELNTLSPENVEHKSGKRYWFKCMRGIHNSEEKTLVTISCGRSTLFCKKCRSFGQYLLDEYGNDGLDLYWSCKNNVSPFEIFRSSKRKILIKCTSGKHPDYETQPTVFSNQKCRCPVCSNRKIIAGINDIATTHKELVKYFKDPAEAQKHSAMSGKAVEMKCNLCGEEQIKQIANVTANGFCCSCCSDGVSYPNKFVYSVLSQIANKCSIVVEREKVFDWSQGASRRGRKLYDFYICADSKIVIEVHGKQHYMPWTLSERGARSLNDEQKNDLSKRDLAIKNGISPDRYIVLDCRYSSADWIKNSIMSSKLPSLLSFSESDVDWAKCELRASSNMIREVCDLWNKGVRDVKEIASCVDMHYGTVTTYLQRGEKLGWTEYGHSKNRPLICTDNNLVFLSARVCAEIFEKIFNTKLNQLSINSVARGQRKSTGGMHFQYLTRDEFARIKAESPHRVYDDEYLSEIA